MRKRVHKLVWGGVLGVALALSGCIQPEIAVHQTETAQAPFLAPTGMPAAPIVTPTAPLAPAAPPAALQATALPPSGAVVAEQFVRQRGEAPNALLVWHEGPLGPDHLLGFSYTGAAGTPCSGFLLLAYQNGVWLPTNGATMCAPQPEVVAQSAFTFILTSDGLPYTIVFGRVQNPSVTAVAAVYDDGGALNAQVIGGGFMLVRPGVAGPTTLTAIDALGNTVIATIPISPV